MADGHDGVAEDRAGGRKSPGLSGFFPVCPGGSRGSGSWSGKGSMEGRLVRLWASGGGTVEGEMRRFSAGFQSFFLLAGVNNVADCHDGVVEDRAGAEKPRTSRIFFRMSGR